MIANDLTADPKRKVYITVGRNIERLSIDRPGDVENVKLRDFTFIASINQPSRDRAQAEDNALKAHRFGKGFGYHIIWF
jgi:hypothetical protein